MKASEVKSTVNIEDIIGGYLTLEKAGNAYRSCCPFHDEVKASFYVYPDTQSYYCFGCGDSGDVIKFIQNYNNCTFKEAMDELGAGVDRVPNINLIEHKRNIARLEHERAKGKLRSRAAHWALHILNKSYSYKEWVERNGREHGYVKSKQIPIPRYMFNQQIVVPIYVDGALTSLQLISEDGFKKFLKNGAIRGGWYVIPGANQPILVEGYATGMSLRQISRHTVIVCFNVNNMKQITMNGRYFISPDNDWEKKKNVGRDMAKEIYTERKCGVILTPEIKGVSDWNDLVCKVGHTEARNYFLRKLK